MLDHEQAKENVARLRGNLTSRRLPRRDRREKETELVRWRLRLAGATQTLDDLRTPERKRIDAAEAKVTSRLAGLQEAQQQRADFFATHPEAARRLDRIDGEVRALDVVVEGPARGTHSERGRAGDRRWARDVPVQDVRLTSASGAEVELGWSRQSAETVAEHQ